MAKLQELFIWMLIFLASVCFDNVNGRPKRSASPSPVGPYCTEAEASSSPNISYRDAITNLVTTANGLSNDAQATKTYMLENFGALYIVFIQNREHHFTTMSDISSTVQQKIETLKQHYAFLYDHMAYVTAAIHGTQISSDSSVENLKTELQRYKQSINRCLCCIRVALIASGFTDQVPTNQTETSELFNDWGFTLATEIWRAYYVIGDGLILASQLKEAYEDF